MSHSIAMPTHGALMPHVASAYAAADAEGVALDNAALYARVAASAQLPLDLFDEKTAVGASGAEHNLLKRTIRWCQQSLRQAGILTRVEGRRGVWAMAQPEGKDLSALPDGLAVLGFSTDLGMAIIGSCRPVFAGLSAVNLEFHAIITSTPYPLEQPRAYGNVPKHEFADWVCTMLEPAIRSLVDGGSLILNLSNDIFLSGSPARSTYLERLVIALEDRFGLQLMDRLIWDNPNKPPGPAAWASKKRFQLNVGWEPLYWFTNNPAKVFSNNQRVLQPHSPRHARLIAAGGVGQAAVKSDGAYRLRPGSYGNPTAGKIPKNVLRFGNTSWENRAYKAECERRGIRPHGAMMPYKLVRFLIEWLTERGQWVADPMAGSLTLGQACEDLGRFWVCVERVVDYVVGGATRFERAPGFAMAPVWGEF